MQVLKSRQEMKQRLTPQQLQFMNLLQLPSESLENKIRKEVEENPALTQENEADEILEGKKQHRIEKSGFFSPEKKPDSTLYQEDMMTDAISWREELEEQLRLRSLDSVENQIAHYIIGALSEQGYLLTPLDIIAADLELLTELVITEDMIKSALENVQKLDPAGIAARDLQESLYLQLQRKKNSPQVAIACSIMKDYFDLFTKRKYTLISEKLSLPKEKVQAAIDLIRKLKPQPILPAGQKADEQRLIPDFFVRKEGKKFQIDIPKSSYAGLRVHDEYQKLLLEYKKAQGKMNKQAIIFIERNIQRAKWFIQAIEQRHKTLLKIIEALIDLQHSFFQTEKEENLRPITLRHIADRIKLDVSTVSRAMNQKSLKTEQNIYPIKFFFSEAILTLTGERVSSRAVKKIIFDLIQKENKKSPYTDEELSILLEKSQLKLARRTVTKYREQMGIPSSRTRRYS